MSSSTSTTITTVAPAPTNLSDLTADLDRAARGHPTAAATAESVAAALTPHLDAAGLLTEEQTQGDPDGYRQHLLHVADDGAFSVVGLVWLPGQATPVHDHVCWCVVGVYQGQEEELRYRMDGGSLITTEQLVNTRGEVSVALPPGDIHLVRNSGSAVAISLHVYGADLRLAGTSIRRRYDNDPGGHTTPQGKAPSHSPPAVSLFVTPDSSERFVDGAPSHTHPCSEMRSPRPLGDARLWFEADNPKPRPVQVFATNDQVATCWAAGSGGPKMSGTG